MLSASCLSSSRSLTRSPWLIGMAFSAAAAAARRNARMVEATNELDTLFGDPDSDDSDANSGWVAPARTVVRIENVCGVEPPPLGAVQATLPAIYRPLFCAIRQCIGPAETRAVYGEVEMRLHLSQAIETSPFGTLQEWLETAKGSRLPVDFSYNKKGQVDFIWQVWPDSWVEMHGLPQKNLDRRNLGLSVFLGATNITKSLIKNVVQLSRGFDCPVQALHLAHKLGWTNQALLSWAVKEHKTKGFALIWHWEGEAGFVTIQSEESDVKRKKLRDIFEAFLKPRGGRMHREELEMKLWEEEPNAFLLTHSSDVMGVIEDSRNQNIPLMLSKNQTLVNWMD